MLPYSRAELYPSAFAEAIGSLSGVMGISASQLRGHSGFCEPQSAVEALGLAQSHRAALVSEPRLMDLLGELE